MSSYKKTSPKNKQERNDDSGLSRNHGHTVKYRLRRQQELEADDEIERYKEHPSEPLQRD